MGRNIDEAAKSEYRQYGKAMGIVVSAIAVAFTLYHVFYITGLIDKFGIYLQIPQHLAMHLAFILALVFLLLPGRKGAQGLPWYDMVLIVLGVGWNLYIVINMDTLLLHATMGHLEMHETIASWINIVLILEATRRVLGWTLPVIAIIFIIYALFAEYFPGFLRAPSHDWVRTGRFVGLFTTGLYGDLLNISATIVFAFMLFAQFLFVTGAGDWFVNIAQAIFGHKRGGTAKAAVIGSSAMGMITGSTAANVASVGVFTIPLMIRGGYRPMFAAAVESAASNGGQIMPPVMGAAAFMMADFLQISYSKIAIAAIIPAVAYYLALYVMVDCEASKLKLGGIPRSELPPFRRTLMEGWQFAIPLGVLIYLLMILGYSAYTAALYASGCLIIIGLFTKGNRITLNKIYLALKNTALVMMMMAMMFAISGIMVSAMELSGLSYRLSTGLVNMAGDSLWLLLLLTAVCALVLGTGLATSSVYVIMAVLIAPALVKVGFVPIAAHFFVFYYGVAALITPPSGSAFMIAAGIANAPIMRTGFLSCRLAIVTFLVPFIFIFQPGILMVGSATTIITSTVYLFISIIGLSIGMVGYGFGRMNYWWRILFIVSALLIIYPSEVTNIIMSVIIIMSLLVRFILSRRVVASLPII